MVLTRPSVRAPARPSCEAPSARADGLATFTTIYPGWYMGRTVHIHVKVHVGGDEVHTGQLYFDDATTDEVYEDDLYASRGERDVRNDTDPIYAAGGESSLVTVKREGEGYAGTSRWASRRRLPVASHETIDVHIDGAAATIELNRPDALNAWNLQLGTDLTTPCRASRPTRPSAP